MAWILYSPTLKKMKVSNQTGQVNRNEFMCGQYKSKKAPGNSKKKGNSPSQNCCSFSTLSETSSRSMTSLIKGASPFKSAFVSFRGGSGVYLQGNEGRGSDVVEALTARALSDRMTPTPAPLPVLFTSSSM